MEFNGKILIVDDEPHIRRFLTVTLKKMGNPTFYEAGNGIEALALYAQHHPDLVLMDINMPGMEGMEALEKLLAIDPDAQVVMLTFGATRRVVQQSIDSGAINFIRKDTPKEEIARLLEEMIARHVARPKPIPATPAAPAPTHTLRLRSAADQPPPAS